MAAVRVAEGEEVHEEVPEEEASGVVPAAPAPLTPRRPPTPLFELTLFFSQKELDQMEEDALFLAHRGVLRLPHDASRVGRIDAFVRRACAHTHNSVQKLQSSDMEAVDQVKKVAGVAQTLKDKYEQKTIELNTRERGIVRKEEELAELMVKWLALHQEED